MSRLPPKSERISFAVTRTEKAAMKRAAAARGVTVTDYLLSLHRREAGASAERAASNRSGQLKRLAKDMEEGRALPWAAEELAEARRRLDDIRAVMKALADHLADGGEDSVAARRLVASKILAERKEKEKGGRSGG